MLADRYDNSVVKQLLLDPAARGARGDVAGPLNYLLVGSDERPAASPGTDQRSDTIMIAHLPAGLDRAYLISVPRDLLVEIPPATAGGWPGGPDKINSAFQYGGGGQGGTRLLSATLSRLTGIRFDGAALVNFAGFQRSIDLLGGIRMCVDTPVRSIHTRNLFEAGCHQMTGAQALDYARQRYDLPNGDFDRQRHQQQLLRAMMDKATTGDMLRNPLRLDQVIRAVGSSFTVDTNGVPLEDLIFGLRGVRSDALRGIQLPSHAETIDEVSYVLLDEPAYSLFDSMGGADLDNWARQHPKWVNPL
ncbi:LCP family protein [Micromonospora sp. WMMD1102]|uniref:LCP family protein n=1 Tax=Micromonospora sp. WMMD1102 TaxID=3016105 RepID=UPI002414E4FA|nr:LCP family protein [Micromonospora sp. WMMD1102]MDG4790820.1 LCP family protein [Micromonospora sp. WMMD1102]